MHRRSFIQTTATTVATLGTGAWPLASLAAEEPITAKQITIGSTLALSGMLGGAGKEHVAGINAAFAAVNQAGGIHGRTLRLVALDDAYAPQRTAENVRKLLADGNAFALMSIFGTANNAAILPLIEKEGVPLVGPVTGAASLRSKSQRYVFHVRPSYADETEHALTLMSKMGLRDMAVVYLDNPFGKEVLAGAQRVFGQLSMRPVGAFALAGDGSNGEAIARQVIDSKAGGVFLATTGAATTSFILPLRARLPALPIAGVSVAVIPSEFPRLGDGIKGVAVARVFPLADQMKIGVVRTFQAQMKASGGSQGSGSALESWINAQLLIEGLRRAGRDVTRDRLRAALASVRQLELGDLTVGFEGTAPFVASSRVDMTVFGDKGRVIS